MARGDETNGQMRAPTRTLRLALAMRGGVSLSVWIGGAVHEIDHTRRLVAPGPAAAAPPDAEPVGASDTALTAVIQQLGGVAGIEIDVIAGTSAGGLNGVLLASALRTGRPLDPLRLVWLEAGDLQRIQRPVHTRDRLSLLDGRIFYETLREVLQDAFFGDNAPAPPGQRLDLLLPVTVLDGIAVTAADDPTTPVTERRHDAVVHIRHHGTDPNWSDLVAAEHAGVERIVANLAAAARSTASFPGAFEPFVLPQPDGSKVDLEGTLLTPVQRPASIQLVDGGVLDNIPVGKAVRAIAAAAADHPTERWLLYLQPNPTVNGPGSSDEPGDDPSTPPTAPAPMTKVLANLAGALVNESLIDDLETLRAHNEDVLARRAERAVLLRRPLTVYPAEDRARFEAQCLVATLDRPHEEISWWPIGVDLPGSQLAGWSTDARSRLAVEMAEATTAAADPAGLRPFEPLIRIGTLLVEWAREIELTAADPADVGGNKRLAYLVTAWVEQAAGQADMAWLAALPKSPVQFDGPRAVAVRRQVVASVEVSLELPAPNVGTDLGLVATMAPGDGAGARRTPISQQLRTALAGIAGAMAAATPADADPDGLAATMRRLIDVPAAELGDRLSAIDAQLAPLHRGRALRDISPIRYRTISGAAPTLFAAATSAGDDAPMVGPAANHRFASVTRVGTGLLAPVSPATKLAGNQISSFSAFLYRHWRANDWMWGRADAVRTLIETILDPAAVKAAVVAAGVDQVMGVVHDYVTAPFDQDAAGGASDVAAQLWSDNEDVLRRQLEALTTASAPAPDAASAARELVIARRQLDIFAVELARTGTDTVIPEERGWQRPKPRVAEDALDERMDKWDRSVRRLSSIWGRRELTETGLRATLVGWKGLLVDQGPLIRMIVAPLLAPLPLVSLGMVLNRRRAIAGTSMLAVFVVSPRLHQYPLGRWMFALSIVAGVLGLLWLLRHRSPGRGRQWADLVRGHGASWACVSLAIAVYALVIAAWPSIWDGARSPEVRGELTSAPYLAPSIAAAVAAVLLWCWAWWLPRLVMALFTAATTLLWVWLSAPEVCTPAAGPRSRCGLQGVAAFFGSLWWGVIVILYVSTWVASLRDFGRERRRGLRASSTRVPGT